MMSRGLLSSLARHHRPHNSHNTACSSDISVAVLRAACTPTKAASSSLWRRPLLVPLRLDIRSGRTTTNAAVAILRLARRTYATGGSLSLSDLARAFQQMGTATTEGLSSSSSSSNSNSGVVAAAATASNQDVRTATGRLAGDELSRSLEPIVSLSASTSHDVMSAREPPSPSAAVKDTPATHRVASMSSRPDGVAAESGPTFSSAYAAHLATLTEAQLCHEVETQLSPRHIGCMLQCLYEVVVRRLAVSGVLPSTSVSTTTTTITAATARDGVVGVPPPPSLQQNHRLLTAVLRMLTLVDVYAVEPAMHAWLSRSPSTAVSSSLSSSSAAAATITVAEQPFSYLLAQGILRWLSWSVSRMDAHTSLQVLHLVAQQNLVWSEGVLHTLVDTIEVHIAQPTQAPRPFHLQEYSLLLDTMARFQAQQVSVARLQLALPAPHPADACCGRAGASADAANPDREESVPASVTIRGATERRAALENHHPVANAPLFHCVAAALTSELVPPHHPTRSATATPDMDALLLRVSNATVLFLTRALSRLHWWSDTLMSALTPLVTRYLQHHAESFAGVVMLVGRHENGSGDAALLFVLQDSLLGLLQLRRRRRRDPTSVHGQRDSDTNNSACAATEHAEDDNEDAMQHDSADQESLMLFSEPRCGPVVTAAVNPAQQDKQHQQHHKAGHGLSLVDLHSFPAFLESLVRFHLRTLQSMSAHHHPVLLAVPSRDGAGGTVSITPAMLQAQMAELFLLLQDDLRDSLPAPDAFAATTASAPLLSQLLITLIRAAAALQRSGSSGINEKEEGDVDVGVVEAPSPLLVELTYAWTAHVARLRPPPLPPRDGRATMISYDNSGAASVAAAAARFQRVAAMPRWRRALLVHRVLIHAGLLQRTRVGSDVRADPHGPGRFFIPKAAVERAPRVRAAVAQATQRLRDARVRQLRQLQTARTATTATTTSRTTTTVDDDDDYHHRHRTPTTAQQQQQQRNQRERPRFASASIRGAGSRPGERQLRHTAADADADAAAVAAALRQPVRLSDVFALYSKAVSRLL